MIAADVDYSGSSAGYADFAERMVLERRVGSRVKIARPIKVVDLANGRHIAGRSRDVSSTGMRLELPMTNGMRPGDTVHVDVGMLSGLGPLTGKPRVIPARVVWVNRQHKMLRPLLTAGVEFAPEWDAVINVA